jgi:triacylglycerol esterase/lipase EstA (alpha/beta hydrolase family)
VSRRQPTFIRPLALILLATLTMAQQCPVDPKPEDACQVGANGGNPVIIVAGTFSPAVANELFLGRRLHEAGYTHCVYELKGDDTLGGIPGTAPIEESSQGLKRFVTKVLAWSGQTQVDVVGHSQGALVARHYVKALGGEPFVGTYVSLAGPQSGTDTTALVAHFLDLVLQPFGTSCAAVAPCAQMMRFSAFVQALNAGDDTPGAIDYYAFYTDDDALVWYWGSGPFGIPLVKHDNATLGDGATNVEVDDVCFGRYVSHVGMILDPAVFEMVDDARADLISMVFCHCVVLTVLVSVA